MIGQFLNVDLEITSTRPVGILKREFEAQGAFTLYAGRIPEGHLLALESNSNDYSSKGNRIGVGGKINSMCGMVEKLSPKARMLWESANRRDFDIGVEGVDGQMSARISISPKSVQQIAAVGGTLSVTVYRPFSSGDLPAQRAVVNSAQGKAKRRPGTDRPIKPKP